MAPFLKRIVGCMIASSGVFILALMLVGCGGNSDARGVSNNRLSPTASSSAALTKTPEAIFKAYTNTTFKVNYPQDWKTTSSTTGVAFTEPTGNYNLTIGFTPNPKGAATPDQLADGGVSGAKTHLKDVQLVKIPSSTVIDGQTWSERAITGTSSVDGQSAEVEAVILATNHPQATGNTRGYIIVYVALKKAFDEGESKYFTPMLKSFQFTSNL